MPHTMSRHTIRNELEATLATEVPRVRQVIHDLTDDEATKFHLSRALDTAHETLVAAADDGTLHISADDALDIVGDLASRLLDPEAEDELADALLDMEAAYAHLIHEAEATAAAESAAERGESPVFLVATDKPGHYAILRDGRMIGAADWKTARAIHPHAVTGTRRMAREVFGEGEAA